MRNRIIILGDSITEGFRLRKSESYPSILQLHIDGEGLPFQIINGGHSGDTADMALARLPALLKGDCHSLMIQIGFNDAFLGRSDREIEEDLRGIVRTARASHPGIRIFLFAFRLPSLFPAPIQKRYAAVYEMVSSSEGITLLPFPLEGVMDVPRFNLEDGIHPTAAGMEIVAENIWRALRPYLLN